MSVKTLVLAMLLSCAAHAETGPVTVAHTPSGDPLPADNRPCEFFQIGTPQWYAVPMTSLGSNAQVLKIENAAQEYLRDPASPNAVITFENAGPVDNCGGTPRAEGITVGVKQ